ncbi:MAG: hypothetical protein R6V50_04200 [Thermoplasmatota archaeon]
MSEKRTLEDLRQKAHLLNCQLFEEDFSPREIEIVGYYLTRIASSYLSYFTHKEYEKTMNTNDAIKSDGKEEYIHL